MARIVGTAGTTGPPRRSHKRTTTRPFVLQGPHDVGTTAQPKARGHAPTVFQEPLGTRGFGGPARKVRSPLQKIQAGQRRQTARAVGNLERAQRGYIESNYGRRYVPPPLPSHLTSRDVSRILGGGGAGVAGARRSALQEARRAAQQALPKPKKGGFSLTPAGVFSEVGNELKGTGLVEKGLGKLAAMDVAGWQKVPGVGRFIGRAAADAYGIPETILPSLYLPGKAIAEGRVGKGVSMFANPILHTFEHPVKSFEQHPLGTALIFRGAEGALSRVAGATARSGIAGEAAARAASLERMPLALTGSALEERSASRGLAENLAQKAADRRAVAKRGTVTVKVPVYDRGPIRSDYRGDAVWHAHDGDHPVTVKGVMGHREGKTYMKVQGSGTGVPLDELSAVKLAYRAKVKAIPATERQLLGGKASKVPTRPVAGRLLRRVDMEHGKGVELARSRRDINVSELDKVRPAAHEAVALINEGVIKTAEDHLTPATLRHDLAMHLEQLRRERGSLTDPARLAHNAENIRQVESLVASKKFMADPQGAIAAARVYSNLHGAVEANRTRHDDFTPEAAARRVLIPFAQRELGVGFNEDTGRFEKNGQVVPDAQIVKSFVARGGDPEILAYVPQRLEFTGSRNFWGPTHIRPGASTHRFKGVNTRSGGYERSFEVLRQQLANATMKLGRHQSVNNLMNLFGMKQPNGEYFDGKNAEFAIHNLRASGHGEYVAVVAARKSANKLLEDLSPAELEHDLREAEPGDSHVVLMRREVWDRIQQHERVKPYGNAAVTAFTTLNRYFRHTALNTSTKWLAGDGFEAFLRMQANQLTPLDVAATIRAGMKVEAKVRALGGEPAVQDLRAGMGGGIYQSQHVLDIHNPNDGALMRFVHAFRQSGLGPGKKIGPKGLADLWDAYSNAVRAFNAGMTERSVYWYALGKEARREVQQMTGSMLKALDLAGPAYEDVAKGLLQSNNIARYSRVIDDIRGRYTNLSPSGRWATSTLTPFAPWYVNALYFLFVTLPVHHPVKTALIAAANQGTEKERKKLMASGLPPWAVSSIPLGGGRYLPLEHLTPAGVFEGGEPAKNAAGLVLPQWSGIGLNLLGDTWYGSALPKGVNPNLVALNTAFETFAPLASRLRAVLEKGGTSVPGSTIVQPKTKPGTSTTLVAGLNKAFNPFRAQGKSGGGASAKLPKGYGANKIDWGNVKIGGAGGSVDWSQVKIP